MKGFRIPLHKMASMSKATTTTAPVFLVFGINNRIAAARIQMAPALPNFVTKHIRRSKNGVCRIWIRSRIFNSIDIMFTSLFL